ncbi:hypothetical protein NDU88_004066 [Pleurodeles waltl]|uniref:Uncharacterized protein n=1 Tax=Pleurodeles waltl TaxID=8319 RepID=A0AAV7V084_PLEWA|nr:hypothetical protein NDU88_004066 [Pleurodeles waltl]
MVSGSNQTGINGRCVPCWAHAGHLVMGTKPCGGVAWGSWSEQPTDGALARGPPSALILTHQLHSLRTRLPPQGPGGVSAEKHKIAEVAGRGGARKRQRPPDPKMANRTGPTANEARAVIGRHLGRLIYADSPEEKRR